MDNLTKVMKYVKLINKVRSPLPYDMHSAFSFCYVLKNEFNEVIPDAVNNQ